MNFRKAVPLVLIVLSGGWGGGLAYASKNRPSVRLETIDAKKPTLSSPWDRVHPYLRRLMEGHTHPNGAPRAFREETRRHGFRWIGDRLHVRVVTARGRTDAVVSAVRQIGAKVHTAYPGEIELLVRLDELAAIAQLSGVLRIMPPRWIKPLFISQGLNTIGANTWRRLPQVGGSTETKIGIVDIGYKYHKDLFGDELPPEANVKTRNFRSDGDFESTEHGTAVAEVISDFVPGAKLYLTAISTSGELASAIQWLTQQGVDVISGSIGSSYRAGDGTGSPEYAAIDEAARKGIAVVLAAGNEGIEHWMANSFTDPDGNGWLNFMQGDELNCFQVEAGDEITLLLEWFDWPVSNRDYDLYLFALPGLSVIAKSDGPQNGNQEPAEFIDVTVGTTGTYCAAIQWFSGKKDVPVELFVTDPECGGYTPCFDYTVPMSSIGAPADGKNAIAVGAFIWDTKALAPYSSRGPTLDGRMKPEITAPTHVDTWAYGHQGFLFTGTSAATPHVTGAIALMHDRLLGPFSGLAIYNTLIPRAIDAGPVGADNIYGIGQLYMLAQ